MVKRSGLFAICVVAAACLSACGGGGSAESGGTSSGLLSNEVTAGATTLTAGSGTALSAHAIMRGAAPASMFWSVAPTGSTNATDPVPIIIDATCVSGTYAPPAVEGASGEGVCNTMLTIPPGAKAGTWRVTNTASSTTVGAVSNSIDITVKALPASGFTLVASSTAVNAYLNKSVVLNIPFTTNPGSVVKNVKYAWVADSSNPSTVAIAGASSSSASVTPLVAGQYKFDVTVTAEVNGFTETATGSVVLNVSEANKPDILDAGLVRIAEPDSVVILTGNVLNRDATMLYAESWSQLEGDAGGPKRLTLANANSNTASFLAPSEPGSYAFQYRVVKTLPDGSQMISTALTTVVVKQVAAPLFTVSAGDATTGTIGTPVSLPGSVGTQGVSTGTTFKYQWTQIGATPTAVTLANATTLVPSFIPTAAGTYNFELAVTATTNGVSTVVTGRTQVVVTATQTETFDVFAGDIQTVTIGNPVSLSGNLTSQGGSAVPPTYSYTWTQVGASPASVTLVNVNSLTPSFVPTVPGTYTFQLSVSSTDSSGAVVTKTAQTQVIASATAGGGSTPVALSADAGPAQLAVANSVVTLHGDSTIQGDSSGVTYSYAWAQDAGNPAVVTLSNATSLTPTFIPTVDGNYGFTLTVTAKLADGSTQTATSTTEVLVGNTGSTFTVSAGDAQVGAVNTAATLPGTVTTQGTLTGVTFGYSWAQVGAVPVVTTLSNPNSLTASFLPSVPGTYTFELTVTATEGVTVTTQTARTQVLVN